MEPPTIALLSVRAINTLNNIGPLKRDSHSICCLWVFIYKSLNLGSIVISSLARFTTDGMGWHACSSPRLEPASGKDERLKKKKKKNSSTISRLPIVQPGLESEVGCLF